jgi:DNA topoisomerase IB
MTAAVRVAERQPLAAAQTVQLRAAARRAARAAGLRYVDDAKPGLRRARKGSGFSYSNAQGRLIRDAATLQRIRKLAVPPAWTDVWICPLANGHIQATGRDARGRKQYRYHTAWSVLRNTDKHARICEFVRAAHAQAARALPPPAAQARTVSRDSAGCYCGS